MVKISGVGGSIAANEDARITSLEQLGKALLGENWRGHADVVSDRDIHLPEQLILTVLGQAVELVEEIEHLENLGASNTEPKDWSTRFSELYRFGNQVVIRDGRPMMLGLHLAKVLKGMLANGMLLSEPGLMKDLKECTLQEFKSRRRETPLEVLASPVKQAEEAFLLGLLGVE